MINGIDHLVDQKKIAAADPGKLSIAKVPPVRRSRSGR